MAHKKGLGSSRNGRDSNAQRLGVKRFGGEHVIAGNVIVRQRAKREQFKDATRNKLVQEIAAVPKPRVVPAQSRSRPRVYCS